VVEVILILKHFAAVPKNQILLFQPLLCQNCAKTLVDGQILAQRARHFVGLRLSFSRASRFICNFICEYFLNTWESLVEASV